MTKYIYYFIVVFFATFLFALSSCGDDSTEPFDPNSVESFQSQLKGIWVYTYTNSANHQETVSFRFDGKGNGCGPYLNDSYNFTYTVAKVENKFNITMIYTDNDVTTCNDVIIDGDNMLLHFWGYGSNYDSVYKRQ